MGESVIVPVILSGGSGTRLWPVSRASYPKQFVNLIDPNRSLLQLAAERLGKLTVPHTGIVVLANIEHRFLIADQLCQVGADVESIILEPVAQKTAPAIALAALHALSISREAKILVQKADHVIPDLDYFFTAVEKADQSGEPLVIFGVAPTKPETRYEYIELGASIAETGLSRVTRFFEKPDLKTAQSYLESGGYLWNSGICLLDAKVYLDELGKFAPEMLAACREAMDKAVVDLDFCRVDEEAFTRSQSDLIDYAVMKKSDKVSVLPFESEWSDLDAWDAVLDQLPTDRDGNAIVGDGIIVDSKNTLVRSEGRLVAALGVEDLLIVETADVVLVSKKGAAQDVKKIVERLKSDGRDQANEHVIGYRPWGTYESIAKGERFQVKKIIVKPGKSLSLQMHHYRAEHWVVVSGVAEVVNGEQTFLLRENESTFIPLGVKHRLTNSESNDLVLIEVQSGSYLGEDDIVRFEDNYGRSV